MQLAGIFAAGAFAAEIAPPKLGRPQLLMRLPKADISIPPDGRGLPAGLGIGCAGCAGIFAAKCAVCHGAKAEGTPSGDRLVGGMGTLASANPVKTVSSYWPYATTLFDYIRRAMPITNPQSLQNDEVYAVVAYILSLDNIVPKDAVLDAQSLPKVQMPNRERLHKLGAAPHSAVTYTPDQSPFSGAIQPLRSSVGGMPMTL